MIIGLILESSVYDGVCDKWTYLSLNCHHETIYLSHDTDMCVCYVMH